MDSMTLLGRAALVTGGSRGMGRAIATKLAREGATVAFSYRKDSDAAQEVVAEVEAFGGRAVPIVGDLRAPGAAGDLARRAVDEVGPISVLVSNAGMASRGDSVTDSTRREYQDMLQMHAFSVVEMAEVVLPAMREARSGSIIVVTSNVTISLPPHTAPYAVAKTSAEAIMRVLALEERAHGIRVNAIAPGLVATDMGERLIRASVDSTLDALDDTYPFGRVCRPADIADAVAFLAAPDSYITGQRLVVDGGGPAAQLY
ncbi:SDR family NAD(P)-dependent oxidoreductase [Microbacterium sp. A196]|uniref:SDR family NAD(P)-dependent oxidoreductase n=1 Tax=Microbacterium sp. A196 TaxID=3457320 RepID=UPI003FD5D28D